MLRDRRVQSIHLRSSPRRINTTNALPWWLQRQRVWRALYPRSKYCVYERWIPIEERRAQQVNSAKSPELGRWRLWAGLEPSLPQRSRRAGEVGEWYWWGMLSHTESRLEVKYACRYEEFSSVSIQRVSALLCPFLDYEFIPQNAQIIRNGSYYTHHWSLVRWEGYIFIPRTIAKNAFFRLWFGSQDGLSLIALFMFFALHTNFPDSWKRLLNQNRSRSVVRKYSTTHIWKQWCDSQFNGMNDVWVRDVLLAKSRLKIAVPFSVWILAVPSKPLGYAQINLLVTRSPSFSNYLYYVRFSACRQMVVVG